MNIEKILAALNPAQREVVLAKTGAVLALAGAGTGKTHTVTARIAGLIADGIAPTNILAVTFTNKAAGEMKTRLRKMLPKSVSLDQMYACTFHSLCVRILRRNPEVVGMNPYFTIIDQGEQIGIIRKAARNVHGAGTSKPEDLLASVSRVKSTGLTPEQFAIRALEENDVALSCIYRKYQEAMRLRGVVDFDDLLLMALQILETPAGDYWRERFKQIVVDEFQDTSEIQYRIVKLLARKWGNLCVVGDDDQSIYSWRGAVPGNILHFGEQWHGAKIIYLQENYRSRNAILKLANAVIEVNTARHKKTLFSNLGEGSRPRLLECENQEGEAQTVVREIAGRIKSGRPPKDFAVIVRANMQTKAFEEELLRWHVPYEVIGGQSFFDCKEVMDMLAFLAVCLNPKDDGALKRIINVPPRGIGEKSTARLIDWANEKRVPLTEALTAAGAGDIPDIPRIGQEGCRDLAEKLCRWREILNGENAANTVDVIIDECRYEEEVCALYDNPLTQAGRMDMAREVGTELAAHLAQGGAAGDYVSDAVLAGATHRQGKKKSDNTVKLITIHSAKGLEYPVVYIAGVEETLLPTKSSINEDNIDEERRLFYVAITRAREELTISHCASRIERGKPRQRVRSRFLGEVPPELFESTSFRPAQDAERAEIFAKIRAQLQGD